LLYIFADWRNTMIKEILKLAYRIIFYE